MRMDNESVFDSYAEDSSYLPDTAPDTESNSVSDSDSESLDSTVFLDRVDSEQGSESIMQDTNSDVIYEIQRLEGYTVSILYTLYIAIGLFFGVVIVKMIYHFTKFD